MGARIQAWLARLGALQSRRPWIVLAVCGLVTLIAGALASRLELRTRFDQLLPENRASVVELHRVSERMQGAQNVFVLLEGNDRATLRKMGDELVPALRAIGPPWVVGVDDGIKTARTFLLARAGLFASVEQLQELKTDVDERWDREMAKAVGADLDDDPEKGDDQLAGASLRSRFFGKKGDARAKELEDRYPDGYFATIDGKALVVLVRSTARSGELDLSRATLDRVRAVVGQVAKKPEYGQVQTSFSGDLVTGLFEVGAVAQDLVDVGVLGVALVLGIVLLYYMRLRAAFAMGATVLAGLAWTFGMAKLTVGHLNVATGFLVSIVAGNGINFGLIYMARYLEARRHGEDVAESVQIAHRETWIGTLSAAVAAAASYGSLGVTEFRGFKHFAAIGSAGMMLCWIATCTVTPAVLVLIERMSPFERAAEGAGFFARLRAYGSRYDAPFAWAVLRAPRAIAIFGAVTALASMVLVYRYVRQDPMEYDLRIVQNKMSAGKEIYRASLIARDILGPRLDNGMVILVDRLDQVKPLKAVLEQRRDAAPKAEKPFESVRTLLDFVPEGQAEKLPILVAIRDKLFKARAKGFINDADWQEVEQLLPPENLTAYGIADLPDDVARAFTEKDGTRGRLVFVEPTSGYDENDLHYLLRWSDAFRETTLPSGEVVRGSGRAVIFADMLRAVISDVPKAILASLTLTIVAVALTFRRGNRSLGVLGALFVGVAWLGAYIALMHVKLNFLNFVALPITFGIGADYAVNVMQRYDLTGDVIAALRSTGGAVVLCSLTTILGYLALIRSLNQAVRSLGAIAVIGEITCLLAAVLVLPAGLLWLEQRRKKV